MEQYRIFWEESFDRIDLYLKSVTQAQGKISEKTAELPKNKKGKKHGRKN